MAKNNLSGVDIDLGNLCSQIAYGWAKRTFTNRQPGTGNPLMTVDGGFSNIMDFHGVKIGISSDGIGTKIELAERTGIYDTLGFDLMAMVADDLAANGIETVNLSNILDVDFLDSEIVDQLMKGLYEAANFARVTVTGGEIAELGKRIGGYGERMHFNWCATGIGILPPGSSIIDGSMIQSGDSILTLKSRGFRSNGFSLVRRIMQKYLGAEWHNAPFEGDQTWGRVLLTPSLIYTPLIVTLLNHKMDIRGIAHITGGGIPDNLARVLKAKKLGAHLDNLFDPLPAMLKIQRMDHIAEEQAYRLWNMGNGMVLVVNPDQEKAILDTIRDLNYQAQHCGRVINAPEIIIDSKGAQPQQLITRYE